MFKPTNLTNDIQENYSYFMQNIQGYMTKDEYPLTNLANFAAIVQYFFKDINWVGFYLYDGKQLYLGPFQGLPACTTIAIGKGVCGTAAQSRQTILVPDTHLFPGHIVCDEASLSEIVVPIIKEGALYGVLDMDSPIKNRFTLEDQKILEMAIHVLIDNLR